MKGVTVVRPDLTNTITSHDPALVSTLDELTRRSGDGAFGTEEATETGGNSGVMEGQPGQELWSDGVPAVGGVPVGPGRSGWVSV